MCASRGVLAVPHVRRSPLRRSPLEAGLPALTKTIAAKNSNYFSHGKKSEAIMMIGARKAELAQAEAI